MTQPQHQVLEPEEFVSLWQACLATDTAPLAELIETLHPQIAVLRTCFWRAIEHGNLVVMRYLLDRVAPVGGMDVEQALQAKSIPVLELLREYGWTDVNMDLGEGRRWARTALNVAAHEPALVSYLLARGADPNLGPGADGNVGAPVGRQLIPNSGSNLRVAVRQPSLESFELLLAHGANPANALLMHAATKSGHVAAMARVLELGAEIDEHDCMLKTGYPTYGTPLLRAIKKGKVAAVKFLLERGANVSKPGYDGMTPLQIVRQECCGGRGSCGTCETEILPEIRESIEAAVERTERVKVNQESDGGGENDNREGTL